MMPSQRTDGQRTPGDDPLARRLRALDHAQLIEIIQRLLQCAPTLLDLVFLPVRGEQRPADAATIRAQVRGILRNR